jgi:hypothetical protein
MLSAASEEPTGSWLGLRRTARPDAPAPAGISNLVKLLTSVDG